MKVILSRDITLKIDDEDAGYIVKKSEIWNDTKKTYKRLYSVINLKGDIVMDNIDLKEFKKEYKDIKNWKEILKND
jgi:hypothetical protein